MLIYRLFSICYIMYINYTTIIITTQQVVIAFH